jgi:hypothetical protein
MSGSDSGYEPQRLQRLFDYWRSKRPDGRLPARKDIDPMEIPDLLSGLILIDVVRDGKARRYRFRLVGTEFVNAVGEDVTGRWLDEIGRLGSTDAVIANYEEAVAGKSPHFWESTMHIEGREHVRYRRLICPLASDGETVDMLIGVFAFEEPRHA